GGRSGLPGPRGSSCGQTAKAAFAAARLGRMAGAAERLQVPLVQLQVGPRLAGQGVVGHGGGHQPARGRARAAERVRGQEGGTETAPRAARVEAVVLGTGAVAPALALGSREHAGRTVEWGALGHDVTSFVWACACAGARLPPRENTATGPEKTRPA